VGPRRRAIKHSELPFHLSQQPSAKRGKEEAEPEEAEEEADGEDAEDGNGEAEPATA
jgi:hypothetical protein